MTAARDRDRGGEDPGDRQPDPEGDIRPELAGWDRRWGRAWTRTLETLARKASRLGIPVRVGSAGLLRSATLRAWGWAGEAPALGAAPPPERERWVLRVPPGQGERVRRWLEEDADAAERTGAPCILVEESALAFLPTRAGRPWPGAEAWTHAARLLGFPASPRSALVPRTPDHLFRALCEGDAAAGRRPVAADRAALLAWDLACAAYAWERSPGAWWLAARGKPGTRARARAAWRRAADRGIRVLPPSVASSAVCGRLQPASAGRAVRLGLEELGPPAGEAAAALVLERERGGTYRSRGELVRRLLQVGVSWRALLALAILGAMDTLPWRSPVATGAPRRLIVSSPGTERRAVCSLSCLSP